MLRIIYAGVDRAEKASEVSEVPVRIEDRPTDCRAREMIAVLARVNRTAKRSTS